MFMGKAGIRDDRFRFGTLVFCIFICDKTSDKF
jgi:hypothetical protein